MPGPLSCTPTLKRSLPVASMWTQISGRMPASSQASSELSTASLTVVSSALRGLSKPSRCRFLAKNSLTLMSRCLAAIDWAVARRRGAAVRLAIRPRSAPRRRRVPLVRPRCSASPFSLGAAARRALAGLSIAASSPFCGGPLFADFLCSLDCQNAYLPKNLLMMPWCESVTIVPIIPAESHVDPDTFHARRGLIIAAFGLSATQRFTPSTGAGRHHW